jgi:hypothetical protein
VKIWWTFKGEEDSFPYNLTTSDGIIITRSTQKISMLAIEAVKARHRGNYTCYAQNKGGHSQHSAYLSINGHFDFKNIFSVRILQFVSNIFSISF